MKLRVLHRYSNGREGYEKRTEIEVDDAHGRWLLADAPGCFEIMADKPEPEPEQPQTKRVRKPPEDKAIREAPEEK